LSTIEPSLPESPTVAASVTGWHDQDGLLREMWLLNQPPQAIADALGRSIPAIMTRAARLGLPRRSAPGRKPTLRPDKENVEIVRNTAPPVRAAPPAPPKESTPQNSLRVCLMCLNRFESAGRHNRICSTCKNSAEYETASALPEIDLPAS
jgi:hypothetical protein